MISDDLLDALLDDLLVELGPNHRLAIPGDRKNRRELLRALVQS